MSDLGLLVLAHLRRSPGAFSRNRNFYAHTDPVVARARRIARHLRALEDDLRRASDVTLRPAADGASYRVVVRRPDVRATRIACLSREELDLLCEDAATREILDAALRRAVSRAQPAG